jgi:hypothetical protein
MKTQSIVLSLSFVAALGAAPVSAATVDIPTLKSGLWEVTRSGGGADGKGKNVTTMCLDEATQAQMRDFGLGMAKDMCTKNEMRNEGNRLLTNATCNLGNTVMKTQSVMTFTNANSYHTEINASYDPPMFNMKESKTVLDGKWISACKPGQKPGDMVLENGQTINMQQMMKK